MVMVGMMGRRIIGSKFNKNWNGFYFCPYYLFSYRNDTFSNVSLSSESFIISIKQLLNNICLFVWCFIIPSLLGLPFYLFLFSVYWRKAWTSGKDWIRCSFWEFTSTVWQNKTMDRKTASFLGDFTSAKSQ